MLENLPKEVDLTNNKQKIIAIGIIGIVMMIVWMVLPPLIWFFSHLLFLILLVVAVGFLFMNYNNIYNMAKDITWKITKERIKVDKVRALEKVYLYMDGKLKTIAKGLQNITSVRINQGNIINDLTTEIATKTSTAARYLDKGEEALAKPLSMEVIIKKSTLTAIQPKFELLKRKEGVVAAIYKLREEDLAELRLKIDSLALQYNSFKAMDEVLDAAKEWDNGTSENALIYKEAENQILQAVSDYTAKAEIFDKKMQPILDARAVNRAIAEEDGLKLIEEYRKERLTIPDITLTKQKQ